MLPSLFFSCDVLHSHDLAATLRKHGISAYPVSGKTPLDERRRFVRMFREGEIEALVSCMVMSEGFDAPLATAAMMCRPTKSGLLYRQQVGRVLRPYPTPQGEREYQQECLRQILNQLQQGVVNQLIVLATGLGKTHIAAQLPSLLRSWKGGKPRGRLFFLVHRDELAAQAADTFSTMNPTLRVGIEKAGSYANGADIVIGSVQTLGKATYEGVDGEDSWEYGDRLKQFDPNTFDAFVCDEAHRGIAKTYRHVSRYFRALKGEVNRDPDVLYLALTATPSRSDNIGLESLCDCIAYNYGIREGINDNWLVPIHAYRCETTVDISAVKTSQGDFAIGSLESAVNTPERNELIAREFCRIRETDQVKRGESGWEKGHAVVCDFVDLSGRHSLVLAPTLFGMRDKFDAKGRDILKQVELVEKAEADNPGVDVRDIRSIDHLKTHLEQIDLLKPPETPPEISKASEFKWLKEHEGSYHLGLPDGSIVFLRETTLGGYDVWKHNRGIKTKLWAARTLHEALSIGEREIPEKDKRWMAASCHWRDKEPREAQIRLLWMLDRKLKQFYMRPDDLFNYAINRFKGGDKSFSRGSVSDRIEQAKRKRAS